MKKKFFTYVEYEALCNKLMKRPLKKIELPVIVEKDDLIFDDSLTKNYDDIFNFISEDSIITKESIMKSCKPINFDHKSLFSIFDLFDCDVLDKENFDKLLNHRR